MCLYLHTFTATCPPPPPCPVLAAELAAATSRLQLAGAPSSKAPRSAPGQEAGVERLRVQLSAASAGWVHPLLGRDAPASGGSGPQLSPNCPNCARAALSSASCHVLLLCVCLEELLPSFTCHTGSRERLRTTVVCVCAWRSSFPPSGATQASESDSALQLCVCMCLEELVPSFWCYTGSKERLRTAAAAGPASPPLRPCRLPECPANV